MDADGLARWNLSHEEIPYGDLVRSGELGLLRGDPLRPYLVLQMPQAGGVLVIAWKALELAWKVLEGLLASREAVTLGRPQLERLRRALKGAQVVKDHQEEWDQRGGGPGDVRKTIERIPWDLDDLRITMGLDTNDEARRLLELAGCVPREDGRYVLGEDQESRILQLAQDDVFRLFGAGLDPNETVLAKRLTVLLDTGELPKELPWDR